MLKPLALLFLTLGLVVGRIPKGLTNTPPPKEQSQHFFSETEKTKSFSLGTLNTSETLVIILHPRAEVDDINFPLPSDLRFDINNNNKLHHTCKMTKMNSLCVVPKLFSTSNNTLKVSCNSSPCEFTFRAFQLPPSKPQKQIKDESLQYLYKIDSTQAMIGVMSTDPKVKNFSSKVRVYANTEYEVDVKDRNILYFYFNDRVEDVLIYPSPEIERYVKVKVETAPSEVAFGIQYQFLVEKEKEIKVESIPLKELRVDMSLSQANGQILNSTNITFLGYKSESDTHPIEIETFTVYEMDQDDVLDINLILKKNAFAQFKLFSMKIVSNQSLVVSFEMEDNDVHDLDVEEQSYISLDKDETVEYNILPGQDSDETETVEVQILNQDDKDKVEIQLSETPCFYFKGCGLKVKAKQAVTLGLGVVLSRQTKGEFKYIPIQKSMHLQLDEGQTQHLIHDHPSNKSKKITVNSNNVIVYIGGETCPVPSADCNEYTGSRQRPILIQKPIYPIFITVEGLELVKFNIRIDQTDSLIELEDGIPVVQTINNQHGLYFKFPIKEREDVHFNLIAPLNGFKMFIANSNEKPNTDDFNLQVSTNHVTYDKKQVENLVFTILVTKADNSSEDSFTLIASTTNSIISIGRGEPHYDVLTEAETKHYVLMIHAEEFEDDIDTHLSFSVFQKLRNPSFTLSLGTDPSKMIEEYNITRSHDSIDLEEYAAQLCDFSEDDICDLFIDIKSHNEVKVDVTVAILSNNTVIELRSGLWQSYEMTELTSTNHFYYIPTNKRYPIVLQFSHTFGAFKISYVLWNNEEQEHDSASWPYPTNEFAVAAKAAYQASDYSIHPSEIVKCFPNCVLLISIVDTESPQRAEGDQFGPEDGPTQRQATPSEHPEGQNPENDPLPFTIVRFGEYSIMASNTMIQLPEAEKMTITFTKNETKYFLIDVNSLLSNDSAVITIFSTNIIGVATIAAKLSSNRDPNHPTLDDHDFKIHGPETQITMDQIKAKLDKSDMIGHEQVELILMVKAAEHARVMIEFTSKTDFIQSLTINTPQTVVVPVGTSKFFSMEYYQDYRIKIARTSGSPLFSHKICRPQNFEDCIEELDKDKGTIVNSKIEQMNVGYCQMCILIMKFTSEHDKCTFELAAVGGSNSATELKEGITVTDYVARAQINRYKINVIKEEETIITVTVFEGDPTVTVSNPIEGINLHSKKKANLIQFHIPTSAFLKSYQKQKKTKDDDEPTPLNVSVSNTALSSVFSELIIEIEDNKYNCSFSISYTLGQRMLLVQDGTLTSGVIRSKESILYSYHNSKNSASFVSISFEDSASLLNCEIKYASYTDDEQEPVLKAPTKLETKSRTPRPSITFQLEEKFRDYEIQLTNKDSKELHYNLTINHVDIIMLPYGYKYPAYLGKNESSFFVLEVFNKGYVQFTLQKCTQSPMSFSYALNDDSFENEDYTYTIDVKDSTLNSLVHAEASTIFLVISSQDPALYSIEANWYPNRKAIPTSNIKAGDNGFLEYRIVGEKEALVTFAPLECESCHANNVTYEYLVGKNHNEVMTQTACQGIFFLFAPIQIINPEVVKPRPSKTESGKLTFSVHLPGQLVYLGLRARLTDGREFSYRVSEISTVWGSLEKNRNYHLGIVAFIVVIVAFLLCMYRRRPVRARHGKGAAYEDLPQEFDP